VAECAEKHGVSTQAVRQWRKANDPRWLEFVAAQPKPAGSKRFAKPASGVGLRVEVLRVEKECEELAAREYAERSDKMCDACGRSGSVATERLIASMLNEKRITLHKLAKDTTGIEAEAGDVVAKTVLVQYAARVVSLVRTLPARLSSLVPDSVAGTVRMRVQAEIDQLCALAAEIPLE
jgi:hypothetical protein